jgi:hypothetical protein
MIRGWGVARGRPWSPTVVPSANPADAPAINAVANGDFSEEAQKLSLNLHGDPCMALRGSAFKAACDQFRFSTAIGLRVRSGTIWQGGLLFSGPTK